MSRSHRRLYPALAALVTIVALIATTPGTAGASTSTDFLTSANEFTANVPNQGWWSDTLPNTDTNDNYIAGRCCGDGNHHSFFTFDLSSLSGTVTSATLKLRRFQVATSDPSGAVDLNFYDVTTDAATLNDNSGTNATIFSDLGSGTNFGSSSVDATTGSNTDTLTFTLNSAALSAIQTAEGGFFSVGAALNLKTASGDEYVFGVSSGAQTLTVETGSPDLSLTNGISGDANPVAGDPAGEKFHVTVTNIGDADASGYTFTATLPTGTSFDNSNATNTGSHCSLSGTAISCDRTAVTVSSTQGSNTDSFDLVLGINADFTSPSNSKSLTLSGQITPSGPDADNSNDTGSGAVTVQSKADLEMSKSGVTPASTPTNTIYATPTSTDTRNAVTFTVTLVNHGPSNAYGVDVTDTLDSTQLTGATFCAVPTGNTTCTPGPSDTFSGTLTGPGAALAPGTYKWVIVAHAKSQLGHGATPPNVQLTNHNIASVASSTPAFGQATDKRTSDDVSTLIDTVPGKPNLIQTQGGNTKIALQWHSGGDGGSTITDWLVRVTSASPATDKTYTVADTGVTPAGNGDKSYVLSLDTSIQPNNRTYSVTIAGHNDVGDGDASDPLSAAPCDACAIKLVPNQQTTLNTASLSVDSGPCFPGPINGQPTLDTAPGATTGDPVVSCFQLTAAQAAAKVGYVTALRETAVGTDTGGCPTPPPPNGSPCVGPVNQQVSFLVPPGSGTSTQIVQTVLYDKTVAASKYGDICNKTPCPGKAAVYDVFLNGPTHWIGSSLMTTWCKLQDSTKPWNPVTNKALLPDSRTGENACVLSYVHINTSQNPSKINGNTPNGKNGNGDFRLDIVFEGDGGLTTCRTCK